MPNLKLNIIANYAGSIWAALMGVAFVPLYIKYMGIESYGLVGFFTTLVSLFSILDMGLSVTLNREMARRSVLDGQAQATRDLLRTLELIYWSVAILIGVTVTLLSYPIARYWLNTQQLSMSDVQQAVMIMGLVVIIRWPFGLYRGGLMGLQKQVFVNGVNVLTGTLRGLGAVLVLWLVSPTIQAFFCWQMIVSGLETLIMAYFLWRALPPTGKRPEFRWSVLAETWGFTTQMMGISLLIVIFNQSDKILLSKLLPLDMFGYYMLAWTIAVSVFKFVEPIFSAAFPRLTQLVAAQNTLELTQLYHKLCQLMAVIVLPFSSALAVFSYEVLLVWTGNSDIAQPTHVVLSILTVGMACNAMTIMPYGLQLACGWMTLTLWTRIVSVVALIPLMIWMAFHYGMIGGAIVWALFQITNLFIYANIMHQRILKGQFRRWYRYDVAQPLIAAVTLVLAGKMALTETFPIAWTIMSLGLITCLSLFFAAIAAPEIRHSLINLLRKTFPRLSLKYQRLSG